MVMLHRDSDMRKLLHDALAQGCTIVHGRKHRALLLPDGHKLTFSDQNTMPWGAVHGMRRQLRAHGVKV